jgi:SPP1 family predicted phage head-tail adaptor
MTALSLQLNQKIRIEQKSVTRNAIGEEVVSWTLLCEPWAAADPIRGREFFAAGGMQSESMTRFVIRYRSDIIETMRVVWRSEHYNINSVIDPKGSRRTLELMTTKGLRDE